MKKQIQRINKKHESGRSMIEMVGVLAVMGLITAAAFVLISSAMRSQKLSRADDDISALAAGVRLLYANSEDFSTMAANANVLKSLGFDNVKPPYGPDSTYTVAKVDTTNGCAAGANKCFTISFNTVDKSVTTNPTNLCNGLAARKWANGGTASCVATSAAGASGNSKLQILFNKE